MEQAQNLLGLLLALGIVGINIYNPYDKPFLTLLLASAVIVAGFWPLYRWIGDKNRDAIPVLPLHSVFYAIAFGMGGLQEQEGMMEFVSISWVNDHDQQVALSMALLGLFSLYVGYFLVGASLYGRKQRLHWPFQVRESGYRFILTIVYPSIILINRMVVNNEIKELLQIADAISNYVFFILVYAFFSKKLTGIYRKLFLLVILPYKIIFGSGLLTAQIAGTVVTATAIGIAYCVTQKRIPYYFIVFAACIFILLQPIKGEFRGIIKHENSQTALSPTEKLQMFFSMGWSYYFSDTNQGGKFEEGINKTYGRINHMMVTAAIIADTPDKQPYLYGETYIPLFTKWIPRFIWPNKPSEVLGSVWARAYGYLGADDYETSFNLPWLPEMYMNFGIFGVIGISVLIGIFFHMLAVNFWADARTPSTFAFGMAFGLPLVYVENNLSMVFGGFFIVVISLTSVSYLIALFFPKIHSLD